MINIDNYTDMVKNYTTEQFFNLKNYTTEQFLSVQNYTTGQFYFLKNYTEQLVGDNKFDLVFSKGLYTNLPLIALSVYILVLTMAISHFRYKFQKSKERLLISERVYKEQSKNIDRLNKLIGEINTQFNNSITFYIDELDKYKTLIRNRDLEIVQLHSYVDEMRIKNNENIDKNNLKNMFDSIIDNLPLNVNNDVKKELLRLSKYLNVEIDINLNENIRKQPYRKAAPKSYQLKEESE